MKFPHSNQLNKLGLKYETDKASHTHDYLGFYEQVLLSNFWTTYPAMQPNRCLLELGWFDGASMRMWREYLPEDWRIVGLDIEEKEPIRGVEFVQGNQIDRELTAQVVANHGPFSVVLDDASHISSHTIRSFELYWPYVQPGGLYIIEDLHVSYHQSWGGWDPTKPPTRAQRALRPKATMEFLKQVADSVHYDHSGAGPGNPLYRDVQMVQFYPGTAVVRKKGDV